jgi:hypothetical protein
VELRKGVLGFRFFGSVDTFVYSDEDLRPTWETEEDYRLTVEHRRQLCVHLAAHAAVSHVGGAWVYMLAVPGVGVRSWTTSERKETDLGKIWGLCSTSDFYCNWMEWNRASQRFLVNRYGWEAEIEREYEHLTMPRDPQLNVVNMFPNGVPTKDEFMASRRREARSQACGYLAGHIADGITVGKTATEALRLCDRRDTQDVGASDIVVAQAIAGLLPPGEYESAVRFTEEALGRPKVWRKVQRVATKLEQLGLIEDDECEIQLHEWLPDPEPGWPPGPGQTITKQGP